MSAAELEKTIDAAFERREEIGPTTKGAVREAVDQALDLLDRGAVRVAERGRGRLEGQSVAEESRAAVLSFE